MSYPSVIRIARAWAVALLAVWIAGTAVAATSHDHETQRLAIRSTDSPREPASSAGPCLVCRVFNERAVAPVAPRVSLVPDAPAARPPVAASLAVRSFARGATRPRSPPRPGVEA